MENFTPSEEKRENWPVIIGFLWAPGLGKTVAMNVVENEENLKDVQDRTLSNLEVYKFFSFRTTSKVVSFELSALGYTCDSKE